MESGLVSDEIMGALPAKIDSKEPAVDSIIAQSGGACTHHYPFAAAISFDKTVAPRLKHALF